MEELILIVLKTILILLTLVLLLLLLLLELLKLLMLLVKLTYPILLLDVLDKAVLLLVPKLLSVTIKPLLQVVVVFL